MTTSKKKSEYFNQKGNFTSTEELSLYHKRFQLQNLKDGNFDDFLSTLGITKKKSDIYPSIPASPSRLTKNEIDEILHISQKQDNLGNMKNLSIEPSPHFAAQNNPEVYIFANLMSNHISFTVTLLQTVISENYENKISAMNNLYIDANEWTKVMNQIKDPPTIIKEEDIPKWNQLAKPEGLFIEHINNVFYVFEGASYDNQGFHLDEAAKKSLNFLKEQNAEDITAFWSRILRFSPSDKKKFLNMWKGHIDCTAVYATTAFKAFSQKSPMEKSKEQSILEIFGNSPDVMNSVTDCKKQGWELGKFIDKALNSRNIENSIEKNSRE